MERKGVLKGWTVTLVQATFLLTILGTFMTRSGVFNSVHSFTQSAIGPTILVFLAAALVFSVVLLATRIDRLAAEGDLETGASRDGAFLFNNLLFVLFTFTVLIGTVFPLVVEATRGTQMSVGRPYFDRMAVPVGALLLLLMGVGPALPWGRATAAQLRAALLPPLAGAFGFVVLAFALGVRNPWTLLTLGFGGYTAQVTLDKLWLPIARRRRAGADGTLHAAGEVFQRSQRRFAGYLVHAGAVVVIVSIAVSSTMGTSKEASLGKGESLQIGAYTLTFVGADVVSEPHRESIVARVQIAKGGETLGTLYPRMNQYRTQREPIGTPAVRSSIFEDLYLSAMNIDPQSQRLGLHAMINPMVGWIWGATAVMGVGGLLAMRSSRRERAADRALRVPLAGDAMTPVTR
jgi:cytochrome c-type biogenesis protein CcmF